MKNEKKYKGCGKQCLVDGELHLQCGDFEIKNNKPVNKFLCHECIKDE